ncbi:DNA-processing protein DprA [Nesterenkonia rhizosphaerae]|uniref:DNA-processing protein DprA n=1 Tax=Nesterenkonia rhizosphaerae TaxID=1348272 RepID=A0ABP9G1L1_9MICC
MEWGTKETRCCRAELSRLIEPGDLLGAVMVQELGPEHAHRLVTAGTNASATEQQRVGEAAEAAGLGPRQRQLHTALQRWRVRLGQLHGDKDLRSLDSLGGGLLIPEDCAWPETLRDLRTTAPIGLWFRASHSAQHGPGPYEVAAARIPARGRSIALVGSREMTDYGARAAAEISEELAAHQVCVVSGGAYGIDAAAHRGALRPIQRALSEHPAESEAGTDTVPGPAATIAVMAGGLDSLYPAGNEQLLKNVAAYGLLLSELPPGSSPQRHRFLHRNRLIAALSEATVVLEARSRSGALSTANHALALDRPVGVLPGSIYSASSAGCHQLLQHSPAQLITDTADVLQLVVGRSAPEQDTAAAEVTVPIGELAAHDRRGQQNAVREGTGRQDTVREGAARLDGLSEVDKRLYDALPVRKLTTVSRLAAVAGLPVPHVLAGLSRLQRLGLARRDNDQWAIAREGR